MSSLLGDFSGDPFPGRPRVLFVGLAESTHTRSWVDLLEAAELNVRLFALPSGIPPADWPVRTYVTASSSAALDRRTRRRLYPREGPTLLSRVATKLSKRVLPSAGTWLGATVERWRPHVVHTVGLEPAGRLYAAVRGGLSPAAARATWVLQLWGGSDLELSRLDPGLAPAIGEILRSCDQLLSDNMLNFRHAAAMGVSSDRFSPLGAVPGTGGVEVSALRTAGRGGRPSQRRMVLWPKAYECPWSKALPVFEALKLCWERLQPCELHMLAMTPDVRMWYWELPETIRRHCRVALDRVPHAEVLELMAGARVMLAPTLVDGTPNTLLEAMATGALPIVSPLDTIRPLVEDGRHVLFARNLYPEEIARALVRAMTDGPLVDAAAEANLELVRRFADRPAIRERVIRYYFEMAAVARRAC